MLTRSNFAFGLGRLARASFAELGGTAGVFVVATGRLRSDGGRVVRAVDRMGHVGAIGQGVEASGDAEDGAVHDGPGQGTTFVRESESCLREEDAEKVDAGVEE